MVGYLKQVKAAIAQPVTTADNYVAWAAHGKALMTAADFALVHTYPIWEGKPLDESMKYTKANLQTVLDAIPDAPIAIGEAGLGDDRHRVSEAAPARRSRQRTSRSCSPFGEAHNITVFVFEAFDEDWKGNDDPDGAEKHWGLFFIDRTPKLGVKSGRLLTRPTSK